MRRKTLIVAVTLGLGLLTAVPAAGVTTMGDAGTDTQPETSTNVTAPGERLAGVVGVQGEELEAGVEHNAFEIRFARAASADEQADQVSERVSDVQQRLSALEERKAQLQERRESGEISEGRYRAEIAEVAAQVGSLQELNNQSVRAAGELPAELLEQRGVNTTAIRTLQERASELSGGEVSEIARDIAGGPPDEVGPAVNQTGPGNDTGPGDDDRPGDGPPGDDPPGDDPPGEGPPGDDPPSDDPPSDDPPGDDPPGDDPPGDDPPGEDPPGDDPPGDDPPGGSSPGGSSPGGSSPGGSSPGGSSLGGSSLGEIGRAHV